MAGIQQAAARSVTAPNVSFVGAGMTNISFVAPSRMGEKGPFSTEQRRLQLALSYGNLDTSLDIGFPALS